MAGFELDYNTWLESELTRQSQKTLQNQIGEFHQILLGGVKGWDDLGRGSIVDLISKKNKIIAEVKNKYNTVKGSDQSGLYTSLKNEVMPKSSKFRGYTAYYVMIIPKKPVRFNELFTPSDKGTGTRLAENEKIRRIDGASFYHLVTGRQNALHELFQCLPDVAQSISGSELSNYDKSNLNAFFKAAFRV
jgi:hypothetical protein